MKKPLFEYLLEKQKSKTITLVEHKVLKMYLQLEVLKNYFQISVNYCKTDKIIKEVKFQYPAWTGYENCYWYTYHYDSFGNSLYSYTQIYRGILNLLKKKDENFPENGINYLNQFIENETIAKILNDRHDSVHQFGEWRKELSDELKIQDWKSAEIKIVIPLAKAYILVKKFDVKIIDFINNQIQKVGK
ncbi:hypothetical protein KKE48_04035 [Patescibacteria group bacterium]|nr:hypothetical protein [Patescibacteria group bacterium]MBU1500008.1 hypothetical protein [Patescibacteria group bacterium]